MEAMGLTDDLLVFALPIEASCVYNGDPTLEDVPERVFGPRDDVGIPKVSQRHGAIPVATNMSKPGAYGVLNKTSQQSNRKRDAETLVLEICNTKSIAGNGDHPSATPKKPVLSFLSGSTILSKSRMRRHRCL